MRVPFVFALVWAVAVEAQQTASVVGVVVDSVHGGPLTGALVVVQGTNAQATVDDHGRFRIDSVPPGTHQLGVFHPLLDSLGVAVGGAVTFDSGEATNVILATPSVPSVIALYCSADERLRGGGAILGKVFFADSDDPASGATVHFAWGSQVLEAPVGATGEYKICGVPLGARGIIRAQRGTQATGDLPAQVATRPLALISLHIPRPRVPNAAGQSVVSGRIVDIHGVPVNGVDVIFDSTIRTVTTDSGAFTLRGLASGSRTLELRKVGFQAMDVPVDLSAAKPTVVMLTLNPAPPLLATVDVTASRQKALSRVGFYLRQRNSAGTFFTSADIDKRNPIVFSDLARTISGLKVFMKSGQPQVTQSLGETTSGKGCVLYELDGVAFEDNPPGTIDSHIQPAAIIGMEVYRPGAAPLQILQDATPGDFGLEVPSDPRNGGLKIQTPGTIEGVGSVSATSCTVVVIWTKATSQGN
jgi:hypothetical protein